MEIYYQPPKKFKGNPTPVSVKKVNSNSFKARQYARYASFRANKLKEEEIAKANSVKEEPERPVLSLKPTKHYPSGDNCCLPNSSIYSAKYRKSGTLLESGEVTARA